MFCTKLINVHDGWNPTVHTMLEDRMGDGHTTLRNMPSSYLYYLGLPFVYPIFTSDLPGEPE